MASNMSNHHDDYPDEPPPPSYEEAVGISPMPPSPIPPRLPPRNRASSSVLPASAAASQTTNASHHFNSNNPFFNHSNYDSNNHRKSTGNTLTIPQHGRRTSTSSLSFPSSPISPVTPGPGPGAHHHPPPAQTFAQLLPASQLRPRQFPPSINLYRDAFPGALQRRYFLGEHQATPLYAVAAWLSSSSPHHHYHAAPLLSAASAPPSSSLVLHNGPSEDYPPLATTSYDNVWGGRRTMHVRVPPLPGQERSDPIVVQTGTSSMLAMAGGGGLAFSFSVEVPWPAAADDDDNDDNNNNNNATTTDPSTGARVTWRKEAYEWRRSNSYAVGGLGGSSQGWKLVRLCNALPPGGLAVAGSGPPSGDGHEVVAVCANAVMSMTKLWKFSFLGTGLSGVLGERWAVMAVMTGLVIWDRDSRRDGLR